MGVSYPGGGGGGNTFDVPFAAGNFAGTGALTWTVIAANVETFRVMQLDKLLIVWLRVVNSTIGGVVAGAGLTVKLPNGLLAAKTFKDFAAVNSNGGATESGSYQPLAGVNTIDIRRLAGDFTASAGNNSIQLCAVVPIQ